MQVDDPPTAGVEAQNERAACDRVWRTGFERHDRSAIEELNREIARFDFRRRRPSFECRGDRLANLRRADFSRSVRNRRKECRRVRGETTDEVFDARFIHGTNETLDELTHFALWLVCSSVRDRSRAKNERDQQCLQPHGKFACDASLTSVDHAALGVPFTVRKPSVHKYASKLGVGAP